MLLNALMNISMCFVFHLLVFSVVISIVQDSQISFVLLSEAKILLELKILKQRVSISYVYETQTHTIQTKM